MPYSRVKLVAHDLKKNHINKLHQKVNSACLWVMDYLCIVFAFIFLDVLFFFPLP